MGRLAAVFGGGAMLLFAAHARADEKGPTAELLFVEGKRLVDQGKLAEGCDKLEASRAIERSFGAVYRLADCRERQGRLSRAWFYFREASGLASARGLAEWQERCDQRAKALEGRLPKLVVHVDGAKNGGVVSLDGLPLADAMLDVEVPVDPGRIVAEMKYADGTSVREEVTVSAGDHKTITLKRAVAAPVLPPEPTRAAAPTPREEPATASSPLRTLGWVGIGVGGAALVFAGIGTVVALGKDDDSRALCPSSPCSSSEGVRANESARDWGNASLVGYVLGGTLALAGVTALLVAPRATAHGVRVQPVFSGTRVGLRGAFW